MICNILLVMIIPFSILAWLNISIYKKLIEKASVLRRNCRHKLGRETRFRKLNLELRKYIIII